ncbi:xanthine dehydrogenase family protein subunit M [Streptomyces sp. PSKA30]|uniref:FAD binding domain-containing protein n=1 Tax=Streptomyces sp. PSKA30 TaxID=2874597 RepID=UPI001CD10C4F|nr:xanthine dehydrogenase family protein subunit M [Streptomyces sp. PSKA30]MBZ9645674.1 xanthine dehydrogenase family protein subunit M [Streptomyces sp. PSKA30]
MRPYDFTAPRTLGAAMDRAGKESAYLAGGTTLVDLMKLEVMTPRRVVDINRLPMRGIEMRPDGLFIGSLERMSDVAEHPEVRTRYPLIREALLLGASQQLRNMASIGGNLLQRTRCGYFRDVSQPCNKRVPGSGCPALHGENRMHAVFGTSSSCAATNPSDVAVPLVALGTVVHLEGPRGRRSMPLDDFFRVPGSTPHIENELRSNELISGITVPRLTWARHSTYLKIRDRQSYEFALASAAVALRKDGRRIVEARIAVGGMGTKPWRLRNVEEALAGRPATAATYEAAVAHAADGARELSHNRFKPALLRRTLVRALTSLEG